MNFKKWAALGFGGLVLSVTAFLVLVLMLLVMLGLNGEEESPGGFGGGPISEIGKNEIPAEYIPIYQAAAAKYGIPWNLLAAVHRVETVFSTIGNMESYAGAIGHMQFMPCTWVGWSHPTCSGLGAGAVPKNTLTSPTAIKQYGGLGVDGDGDGYADPFNLKDAIFSSASYLAKNGAAAGDYRRAVFTYNHSDKYVSDVLGFMESYVEYQPIDLGGGTAGFNRPSQAGVNSPFGMRFHPVKKQWRLHAGLDFDCATGDPIYASKAGRVVYAGWQNANNPKEGLGIYVQIDHGGGFKTNYGHMSGLGVQVGATVQAGQVVGACGATGIVTGDHLHFEILKSGSYTDPAPYLGL